VAIAGAHGKIAARLSALLTVGGDSVIGLIRNPDHAADLGRQGASAVVCDLGRRRAAGGGGARRRPVGVMEANQGECCRLDFVPAA
jgi:hypothetical protein